MILFKQVEYIRQSSSLKYISIKHLVYLFLGMPLSIVWGESYFRVLLQSADQGQHLMVCFQHGLAIWICHPILLQICQLITQCQHKCQVYFLIHDYSV